MRTPRVSPVGSVQHVISRFVDHRWELTSDLERDEYLRRFGLALGGSDWTCLAYCLMSNHLHFAMVAGESPLDDWALRVHSPFARWLNARHGRIGPVFADRPANYTIAPALVARTIAYIHNNPVRARVVDSAHESTWSSHRAYLGLALPPDWLACTEGIERSGFRTRQQLGDFVTAEATSGEIAVDVARVRADVRKRGSIEVGSPMLGDVVEYPLVARPFGLVVPTIQEVVSAAIATLAMSPDGAVRRYAHGQHSQLRRVVVHSAHMLGIATSHASAALNISRQRGSRIGLTALSEAEQQLVARVVRTVRKVDKVYTVPRSRRSMRAR